jgi:nitrogen regulatory protein PII
MPSLRLFDVFNATLEHERVGLGGEAMKLIVAMIRPETLLAVQEALSDTDAHLMSVGEVSDLRRPHANVYRGSQYRVSRVRLRLEIVVTAEEFVDEVVSAIARGAGTNGSGRWGGEDVFVMNLDDYRPTASRAGECAAHR